MSEETDWEQRAKKAEAELEKMRKATSERVVSKRCWIALFVFIFLLWLGFPWLLRTYFWLNSSEPWNEAGSFTVAGQSGDMFGSLNTLFSGLAFAGLLYALWMQREDLRLQRQEMLDTRSEMEAQTQAMRDRLNHQKEMCGREDVRYAADRAHALHREEIDKVYELVEVFVSRIHSFSIVDANGCLEGERAFEKLCVRVDDFLKFLQIYTGNRRELVSRIEELYAICSKVCSVESAFIRALRCILFETENVSGQERDEMVAHLYLSRGGYANLMLHIATEGNPFYPADNQYVKPLSNNLINNYSPTYQLPVVRAFLYVLSQRYTHNRNCENIAECVEGMLHAHV